MGLMGGIFAHHLLLEDFMFSNAFDHIEISFKFWDLQHGGIWSLGQIGKILLYWNPSALQPGDILNLILDVFECLPSMKAEK